MIVTPEKKIRFEGVQDKEEFFQFAREIATLISQRDFIELNACSEGRESIAWLYYSDVEPNGFRSIEITVNQDKCIVDGGAAEEAEDVLSIIIRHEAAELWYIIGPEGSQHSTHDADGQSEAHHKALVEEWRLAFELGCEIRYIELIQQWAHAIMLEEGEAIGAQFLNENMRVYEEMRSNLDVGSFESG